VAEASRSCASRFLGTLALDRVTHPCTRAGCPRPPHQIILAPHARSGRRILIVVEVWVESYAHDDDGSGWPRQVGRAEGARGWVRVGRDRSREHEGNAAWATPLQAYRERGRHVQDKRRARGSDKYSFA